MKRQKPSPEMQALVAELEAKFWRLVVPRICDYISHARLPLNDPRTLDVVRRIADATAKEVFNAAMRS